MVCFSFIIAILGLLSVPSLCSVTSPYSSYILAPPSRTIYADKIYAVNGSVTNAKSLTEVHGNAIFKGANSSVTYDFGKNVAGLVTFVVQKSDKEQTIGITFTESSMWISGQGSDATANDGVDEPLWFTVSGPGTFTPAPEYERGGFRYMSVILNTTGTVEISELKVHFTPMPHVADNKLQAYEGYFHCNDELLNKIWYAGAYTTQLCTISPVRGDSLQASQTSGNPYHTIYGTDIWYNNYTITNGSSTPVDGAKRDRLVWAGDLAVTIPSTFVSTNDLISAKNALQSLFVAQNNETGCLPWAGFPFGRGLCSFTYHLYGLIAVANIFQYSNDRNYLSEYWDQWKFGMNFSLSAIDSSGLANVTSSFDWLREGMGGHNIEANSILYFTLNYGLELAKYMNDDSVQVDYANKMRGIKEAANERLWNATAGLFNDNDTGFTVNPQDGNVWSIKSGVADVDKIQAISSSLRTRWGTYGAPAPEAGAAISPFISSIELEAHMIANQSQRALDLIRLEWGFMLNDPRTTQSTFIEGYSTDGSLHYPPYSNDPRVSHAHGWSTGPTSTLTFYVAGMQILSPGGAEWLVSPHFGDLTEAAAGFKTPLGSFSSSWTLKNNKLVLSFSTPKGTKGSLVIPVIGSSGKYQLSRGSPRSVQQIKYSSNASIEISNLEGGDYSIQSL